MKQSVACILVSNHAALSRKQGEGPNEGEWKRLTVLLHALKELDNDLGRRADHDLPLSALLRVRHSLQAVGEHTHSDHLD